MTERLTDAFVVKTSDATVANTNIGGRFRIDTISNDSLRLSVDDDDDLFTEENNAGNTEQTVGTWQYGSVTDGRGGSDGATGVVSNEDVWILRHPVTGEAVKVSRVRIEADDGQQGTDVFLGTYYLFDGPFQKGVDYEVVGYDHYPDEKDGHRYSDYSSSRIVCFAAGTLILTERGLRPVDRIRPGDRVQTADNGLRPVIWHGRRQVSMLDQVRDPTLRPIVVRQGAIGNDAAFRVSRQHRLLVDGHFVGAGRLARMGKGLARVANGCRAVDYHHLLREAHEVLFAHGAGTESLLLGPVAERIVGSGCPAAGDLGPMAPCRPVLPRDPPRRRDLQRA